MRRVLLFDRDGTLIEDRPPNDDPRDIVPMPTAAQALRMARAAGCAVGVVTNQPALAAGRMDEHRLGDIHSAVEARVGSVDAWFVCPHDGNASCACRKPAPGLIQAALEYFGVGPQFVAVIGDIGGDMDAASRAGTLGILVPDQRTRRAEVEASPHVCDDLVSAVRLALYLLPMRERRAS